MTKKHTILTAINSKYIHSNLAVYCLRAYAKPYIDEVEIAEYTINQQVDDILAYRVEQHAKLFPFLQINGSCHRCPPPLFRPCRLSGPFHVAPLHLVVEIAAVLNFSIPDHMGQPPLSMLLLRLHIAVAG